MAEERKVRRGPRVYDMRCEAIIPPPGTKCTQRLPREGDPEPSQLARRLLVVGVLLAVLGAGMAIGRFLLP